MSIAINQELAKLNIDILTKTGIKKSTINKLHKLKVKLVGDLSNIEAKELEQLLEADGAATLEDLAELLSLDIIDFTRCMLDLVKDDPVYEILLLHINNHTHQEIAQKYGSSKEKLKQSITKFLQTMFSMIDALGPKLMGTNPYLVIEELEEVARTEEGYQLLLLAFKTHDTKWIWHNEEECFTLKL